MKTIGLIGGLSWESTSEYYRIINEQVRSELGGVHSAKCLLYSFDFEEIVRLQKSGAWDMATAKMVNAAVTLERAGVDLILICTNTMHKMAEEVQSNLSVPLLHIVDATASKIKEAGLDCVGLLGTKYTMDKDFYKDRFQMKHDIKVITPDEEDKEMVHNVIFNELCQGKTLQHSKERYLEVIERLRERGAQAVILGCTEISILIQQSDTSMKLFDTTSIHAKTAVELVMGEDNNKKKMIFQ
ncbi:aspartate/glutamate racemase family protein [Pseudalkalibacillus salsuginis]|uniref:aspartate/glutamate racemase family protein n=1 Tax=Pseudalkalibacillus salsuginis TaxID=2910972 RepID=UPI001F15DD88|nr:aspartate/glutamate racemase family protein [Pseudalkalibacillus salsuginis]MCF6409806.1 aspartate/glutamate racemase family protein [Pseudalkalibacillus salsuginis]